MYVLHLDRTAWKIKIDMRVTYVDAYTSALQYRNNYVASDSAE